MLHRGKRYGNSRAIWHRSWSAAYTADGRSIVTGSADGTALVVGRSPTWQTKLKSEVLTADALKDRWDKLSSPDARVAYRAIVGTERSISRALSAGSSSSAAPAPAHKVTAVTEGPVGPPEVLRVLRAIACSNALACPKPAVSLNLSPHGAPSALQTKEARSTLARLSNRTN